jgi:hypothetical protein
VSVETELGHPSCCSGEGSWNRSATPLGSRQTDLCRMTATVGLPPQRPSPSSDWASVRGKQKSDAWSLAVEYFQFAVTRRPGPSYRIAAGELCLLRTRGPSDRQVLLDENRSFVRILFRKEVTSLDCLPTDFRRPLTPDFQWSSVFGVEGVEWPALGP